MSAPPWRTVLAILTDALAWHARALADHTDTPTPETRAALLQAVAAKRAALRAYTRCEPPTPDELAAYLDRAMP